MCVFTLSCFDYPIGQLIIRRSWLIWSWLCTNKNSFLNQFTSIQIQTHTHITIQYAFKFKVQFVSISLEFFFGCFSRLLVHIRAIWFIFLPNCQSFFCVCVFFILFSFASVSLLFVLLLSILIYSNNYGNPYWIVFHFKFYSLLRW